MQSKTSYFNPTLFRKNLMRFWPLWGGASLLGVLAPLTLLVNLIDAGFHTSVRPLELTEAYYTVLSYAVPVASLVYAILCALTVWHYLYNARSVSLYHSLPITRKGLFCTNFLSGMAMMLIPYAIVGVLTILISILAGCFEPVGLLVTILGVIGDSFFFFSFATIIVFVTGNAFACVAFYAIFNFFFAAAEMLVDVFMTEFYFGVSMDYDGILSFLSPLIYLMQNVSPSAEPKEVMQADGWIEHQGYAAVHLDGGWVIGVYALIGVVFLACAWMLYKRRRSESAGDVVAVGWMKPVFRYGVALCCGMVGGMLLYKILFESFKTGSTANALPMAFCMAVAGVIGYYIATMLLTKSVKVFRGGTWKGAVGTLLVSAAVCGVIALDPAGVESWIPSAEELNYVNLRVHGEMGGHVSAIIKDPTAIQKILDLHETIIAEKKLLDKDGSYYLQIHLGYGNRDGSYHWRQYTILREVSAIADTDTLAKVEQLACDPLIQEDNIFYDIQSEDVLSARLTSGYLGDLYDTETKEVNGLDLTREQAQALEDAIRRDIDAGHFGRTVLMTDHDEFYRITYFGDIQLNYNTTYQSETPYDGTQSNTISISISTYCTETLQALEDLGIVDATHRILTREEYYDLRKNEDLTSAPGPYDYPDDFYDEYAEYASYAVPPAEDAVYYTDDGSVIMENY